MPNNIMFSNKEALRKAVERVEWKLKMARSFHFEDPIYGKYAGGQYGFDARDLMNFYTFFFDLKDFDNMSEEERINQFNSEARKIAHAFYETHGEKEGMPDYKSVEPYIRRMYDEVDADFNIDWDDVDAIEHFLSSWNLQQTLGTMAEKFVVELTKSLTLEEKQSIDNKMQSTFASQRILQSKLIHENREYSKRLSKGSFDEGTIQFLIEAGISVSVAKATKNGYDPIVLDPEYSEAFKNYFVNDEFEMDQTGELSSDDNFNQDDATETFFEYLPRIASKGAFEHVVVQSTTNDYIYPDEEFLLIDGKSLNDYIKERVGQGLTEAKAKKEAGKWLRSAMLDGNSVVTLMRPIINGDGSVVFQHQQIKTDLDKVNAIDRAENYSWFRRALDALRIYRIPKKCVSNKARDAVQAQKLAGAELQSALKAVEDKFIERYNLRASQDVPYRIQSAFPKISRIENVLENQLSSDAPVNSVETDPVRVSLNLSSQDLEKPVSNVPEEPKEINSEEVKIEENKIEEPQVQAQSETVSEEPAQENNVEENKVEEPEKETKTEEPVVEEPVVEEPVVEEPVVEEPVQEIKTEETVVEEKPEVQSEEEVAKIQAEAEETQKKLEEIRNNVQQITVTEDNFKELFEAAKNDTALEAKVRVELEAVLNEVYTGAYVHDNATGILYTATTIPNLFPDGQFTTEDSNIGGMVFEIFDDAYNKLDSTNLDIDQKIIYAQKIADIVVRNYPPVCHDIDGFSKFADNYIINGTTLYSQDKLRSFLAEKEIPQEEIEAHVSRINGAVAKPDDVKEERYEPEQLDNPFEHGPNYIHQNKAEAPKINRFKPRRLFGQGEGELYSAGRHQARKDELERLRSYDQEAMAKTEAIAEDALEHLEDIEEETAIETNENEIVAEKPAEEVTERESIPGLKDDVEGKVNADKSTRVIDENNKKAPSLNNN